MSGEGGVPTPTDARGSLTNNTGRLSDHRNGFCWIDPRIRETRGKQVLVNKENRSQLFLMLSIFFLATHSSTLAWKIPWAEEPGRLQSMGSLRVGHD